MNIKNFKEVLPILMRNEIVAFLWGMQGIGKTQSVKQVAKSLGDDWGFVHLHLATQEVGDLVGLLVHNADGTVKHARPEWFPTSGRGIIFLDELNRAHPDVIQAMFSFITSKTIHTHRLPEGWHIVAAGNYQCDTMTVTDTSDAAWMSRFCHIELKPTVQEFVAYAEERGAESVAEFIAERNEMLEGKAPQTSINVTPDRRAWLDMIGPLEEEDMDEEVRFEVYSGIVGRAAAASLRAFKTSNERKLRLKDILKDYGSVEERIKKLNTGKETRFDALNAPLEELTTKLEKNSKFLTEASTQNLKRYFMACPLELVAQFVKKVSKMNFDCKDALLNDAEFNKKLLKKNNK